MKKYIEAIPEMVKEVNNIVHMENIKDAVNTASSVSSLVLKLFLTPIINKITEPSIKKFLKTLVSIIDKAITETGLTKETAGFIKHNFKR